MKHALFVLSSHDTLGSTGRSTGWYLEEAAAPYEILRDAGWTVDFASTDGGAAPIDPSSLPKDGEDGPAARFLADPEASAAVKATRPVADVSAEDYDLVFLPGGHGTMWDFPASEALGRLVAAVHDKGGVVGAVCHGPAGLVHARLADGTPIVSGRRVAGFSNEEEEAAGLTKVVPFLLEDALKSAGGLYAAGPKFQPFHVADGRLVTGQNPASSADVARAMLAAAG